MPASQAAIVHDTAAEGWTPIGPMAEYLFFDGPMCASDGEIRLIEPMSPKAWEAKVVEIEKEEDLVADRDFIRTSHPFDRGDDKCVVMEVREDDDTWEGYVALVMSFDRGSNVLTVKAGEACNHLDEMDCEAAHRCGVVAAIKGIAEEILRVARSTDAAPLTVSLSFACKDDYPFGNQTADGLARFWRSMVAADPALARKDLHVAVRTKDGIALPVDEYIRMVEIPGKAMGDAMEHLQAFARQAGKDVAVVLREGAAEVMGAARTPLMRTRVNRTLTDRHVADLQSPIMRKAFADLLKAAGHGSDGTLLVGAEYVVAIRTAAWEGEDWRDGGACLLESAGTTSGQRSRAVANLRDDFGYNIGRAAKGQAR